MDQNRLTIMTIISRVYRTVRRLMPSPGLTLAVLFLAAVCLYYNEEKFRLFFQQLRARLQLPDSKLGLRKPAVDGQRRQHDERVDFPISDAAWQLHKDNVGVYAVQGGRDYMEDRFNVISNFENTSTSIYGIFDGHGGEFASEFVEKAFFKSVMVRLMQAALTGSVEDHGRLLTAELLAVDDKLLKLAAASRDFSGCTALVCLLANNILTVANVGDSRGVLCDKHNKAIPLSFDHKPNHKLERQRIERAGGFVSFNGVWRVSGILATSRALGDLPLKRRHLVVADADVLRFDLTRLRPSFILLATDGLWDVFTNDEAVAFIQERLGEPLFGAKSIVREALHRGSLDNITVMIIDMRGAVSSS